MSKKSRGVQKGYIWSQQREQGCVEGGGSLFGPTSFDKGGDDEQDVLNQSSVVQMLKSNCSKRLAGSSESLWRRNWRQSRPDVINQPEALQR